MNLSSLCKPFVLVFLCSLSGACLAPENPDQLEGESVGNDEQEIKAGQAATPKKVPRQLRGNVAQDPTGNGYHLVWQDEFDAENIDVSKWYPYFLPQWGGGGDCEKASYVVNGGTLKLLTLASHVYGPCLQKDHMGLQSQSGLMTGLFTGPAGSKIGTHEFGACRTDPTCVIQPDFANKAIKNFAAKYGYFEMRATGCASDGCAWWMVGYEDKSQRSGELDMMEENHHLFPGGGCMHMGVHAWDDPQLKENDKSQYVFGNCDDFAGFHTYGMEWTASEVTFYYDGRKLKTVDQSPSYEMIMLLQLGNGPTRVDPNWPDVTNKMEVDYIRVYKE